MQINRLSHYSLALSLFLFLSLFLYLFLCVTFCTSLLLFSLYAFLQVATSLHAHQISGHRVIGIIRITCVYQEACNVICMINMSQRSSNQGRSRHLNRSQLLNYYNFIAYIFPHRNFLRFSKMQQILIKMPKLAPKLVIPLQYESRIPYLFQNIDSLEVNGLEFKHK